MASHECACGRPARPGGLQCAACYQRLYRADPVRGAERRAKHRLAVKAYEARVPEKKRRWVRNYRARIGQYVPALSALRAAIKAVDAAAQRAGVRRASQPGRDHDLEW
jgi:hypothetical protein